MHWPYYAHISVFLSDSLPPVQPEDAVPSSSLYKADALHACAERHSVLSQKRGWSSSFKVHQTSADTLLGSALP